MQLDSAEREPASGPDRTSSQGKSTARAAPTSNPFPAPKPATILFWCGSRVWVRCPHYNGQHHFRFQGYDVKSYKLFCRVPSKGYIITFPACFDIDKEQGWLVNLHPKDTEEQATSRALTMATHVQVAAWTVLLGQENVEAAMPGTILQHRQQAAQMEIQAQAYSAHIRSTTSPTSLFLRCPQTGTIKYMVEAATLPAVNEEGSLRTVAALKRGPGYPEIMAISGIGKLDNVRSNVLRTQTDRFQHVCDLMKYLGYESLPAPDNATAGVAFYATHAEKQLIAYFVYKHVITPEDRARVYTFESRNGCATRNASGEGGTADVQPHEEKTGKNLELELPPHAIKGATILVSQPMCRDCEVFLKCVNLAFHIQLTVTVSQVTVDQS